MKNNFLLITFIIIGVSLIPIGDTAGKLLMQQGASSTFTAWSRFVIGFLLVLPLSKLTASELKLLVDWKILLRAMLFVAAVTSILKSLETEPIANVFGAFFIGPIISYFLAALLLKESITKIRSILLIIGFVGALLVIKPGFGMTTGIVFAALAGFFYGCFLVCNRWLAQSYRPRFILLSTLLIGAIFLTPFMDFSTMPHFTPKVSFLLVISAAASALGNLIIIEANKHLPANVVAPFIYIQLIAATLLSVAVFNSWPDLFSLLGLLIIFLSGILSFLIANQEK